MDQRTIEKYEKEAKEKAGGSWYLAFIMDTNEEERAKGKTVEVGRAIFTTEKRRYTILDAPGHKNYGISLSCDAHMLCFVMLSSTATLLAPVLWCLSVLRDVIHLL